MYTGQACEAVSKPLLAVPASCTRVSGFKSCLYFQSSLLPRAPWEAAGDIAQNTWSLLPTDGVLGSRVWLDSGLVASGILGSKPADGGEYLSLWALSVCLSLSLCLPNKK